MAGRYRAGRRAHPGRHAVLAGTMVALALLCALALPDRMDASTSTSPTQTEGGFAEPQNDGLGADDDSCLRLRDAPSLSAAVVACVPGASVSERDREPVEADGRTWRYVEANGHIGWTAEELVHAHSRVVQPPAAAEPGAPSIFDAPPPGGLVMGIAGTSDLDSLIEAQSFEIQVIATIDVRQQRWLMHIVDAPSMANSLTSEVLRPETIIIVRRAPPELPAEVAPPTDDADDGGGVNERPGGTARITYYYCERGSNRAGWGDGGGWCGAMRSGKTVYAGAAACSATNLGQRFRIVGDPTERTYTCEDTGGGVRGNHRDIWFRNSDEAMRWYAAVGTHAEIVIVE